ncbi:uncharacterized protein V1516DRAFT_656995 [Lipomyces oligophaga]|uniref:uncharacterized protein n=1 Tax=Lipomyces oligophaga TaxID=45792 RepID=UPI0034CFE045
MKLISFLSTALLVASAASAQLLAADLRADFYLPSADSQADAFAPFRIEKSTTAKAKSERFSKMLQIQKDQDTSRKRVLYGELKDQTDVETAGHGVQLLMTDALGVDREVSIFAGLVRQVEELMYRLQDPAKDTMVLAPTNKVMQALPRKPWEDSPDQDPVDVESGARGEEERALENIQRFVLSHVVYGYGFPQEGQKVKCGAGVSDLWFSKDSETTVVHRKNTKDEMEATVLATKSTGNGQVWTIDQALN